MGGTIITAHVIQRSISYRIDLPQEGPCWHVHERYAIHPGGPCLERSVLVHTQACADSLPSPLRRLATYNVRHARSPRGQFRYHRASAEVQ